ncbi:MAG: hypothetical protein EBU66_20210, partial [Bacteroidetes bacterium]|nr:hypothetical protein [Bacteroidota bacterium]
MSNGGLANLGLTCGINTLIQCIGHSTRLREIILKEEKQENKLTRQVSDVIRKLIIEKVSINPAGLIQQIYRSFKGRITQFEQHDIGELWMLISDKINEEIGIKYNEPDNEIDKVIHKYNNGLKSEWTETVQGISKTTIFCKN